MKQLTLEEIKKSQLETLIIFRDFCEKNKLKYYLTFGTLLGAVRHKGYIPWDDDVDIFMPRSDYDFLIKHFNEATVNGREAISKEINPEFYLGFAKIIDRNTEVIEKGQVLKIGVWIDIFPMDYLADDKKLRAKESRHIGRLNCRIHYASLKPSETRAAYKNAIIRIIKGFLPSEASLKRRRMKHVSRIVSAKESNTYGLLYRNFGIYGVPSIPRAFFEPAVTLEFEGERFCAPKEYDALLRMMYGNYLKLPPAKKQVRHHSYIAYRKEGAHN